MKKKASVFIPPLVVLLLAVWFQPVAAQGITNPGFESCTVLNGAAPGWPGMTCTNQAAYGSWGGNLLAGPSCQAVEVTPGVNRLEFYCFSEGNTAWVTTGGVEYEGCDVDEWIQHSIDFSSGSTATLCLESNGYVYFDAFTLSVLATATPTPTPTPTNTPTATPGAPVYATVITQNGETFVVEPVVSYGEGGVIVALLFSAGVTILSVFIQVWHRWQKA